MTRCLLAEYSIRVQLENEPTEPSQPFFTNLSNKNCKLGSFHFRPLLDLNLARLSFQKRIYRACAAAGIAVPAVFTLGKVGDQNYLVRKDLRLDGGTIGYVDSAGKPSQSMIELATSASIFHNEVLMQRLQSMAWLFTAATYDHRLGIGQTLEPSAFFAFGYTDWRAHFEAPEVGIFKFDSLRPCQAPMEYVFGNNIQAITMFMVGFLGARPKEIALGTSFVPIFEESKTQPV